MASYFIKAGTHMSRHFRSSDNWEFVTSTKDVTYTEKDICNDYILSMSNTLMVFYLPAAAAPYDQMCVSMKSITIHD